MMDYDSASSNSSSSDNWRERENARRNRIHVYSSSTSSSMCSSSLNSAVEKENQDSLLTRNLLIGLDRLRQEERFCDITLKVNDVNIPAHKNILCAYSPYFNAMFTGYFKEKNDETIIIENLDPYALKLLIDYLYTGKLEINKDNVENVLNTAHFLQIDPAQEICCEFISKDISDKNCLEFITIAGKYGSHSLLKTAIRKTVNNFFKLYGKDELLNIEIHELKSLLSVKKLKYYPPSCIFNLIKRWVEKLPQERLKYFNELLCDNVDAGHITEDLVNESKILIEASSECDQWLKDFENSQNTLENYLFLTNRLGKFSAYIYEMKTGNSIRVENGTKMNPGASYTNYNNSIYVHGGWKSKASYIDNAFCFNIFEGKWTKFIPLQIPRAYHRSCILNGYLYIVGGGFTTRALECVETVDLTLGTNVVVNNLINARSSMGLVTYANSIYAVAGINGEENLVTIERLDPREGQWNILPKRCYGYGVCSSVVVDDSMYCAMGPGESMERYDFRNDEWTLIKTQRNRYPNELFTVKNSLHGIFYDNMAEYDLMNGTWNTYRVLDNEDKSNYVTVIPLSIPEL